MPGDPVARAFAAYREAWHAGECPDPDVYCRLSSEHRDELRARIENFLLVVERLPRIGTRFRPITR
jgi:hypothetical protein